MQVLTYSYFLCPKKNMQFFLAKPALNNKIANKIVDHSRNRKVWEVVKMLMITGKDKIW